MRIISAAAVLAALAVSPVYADCVVPAAPANIPDGNTATLQDMLASQKAVSAYNDATNTYLDCIKHEHDAAVAAAGSGISSEQRDKLDHSETQQHNAAVDQLNAVAARFNEQVRIFKAKASAPPPSKSDNKSDSNSGGNNGKG